MPSLQNRIIAGGLLWAVVAVVLGGFAMLSVFDLIAAHRFNRLLDDRLTQVVRALGNAQSPEALDALLSDPAYQRPYSGRYWQIEGPDGAVYTSRSLFDMTLDTAGRADQTRLWTGRGPSGPVRGIRETLVLDDGSEWTVSVAASLSALAVEREIMRRYVTIAFSLVGFIGIAGAWLITLVLLRPLRQLRHDVVHRWDSGTALNPEGYPSEVAPLVEDINALMSRNREVVDLGRRQAADLAHALKTPSAALRNELAALGRGTERTKGALDALDRIDAQIIRSLARMRAESASGGLNLHADLGNSMRRLERLFRSLPEARQTGFELSVEGDILVAADAQDIEEMVGNLLENAFLWSYGRVTLRAGVEDGSAVIRIEDDGPGIEPDRREAVLRAGTRLDTAVPGTGLGLSIAGDLAKAYGGLLALEDSELLGGLSAVLRLPLASSSVQSPTRSQGSGMLRVS